MGLQAREKGNIVMGPKGRQNLDDFLKAVDSGDPARMAHAATERDRHTCHLVVYTYTPKFHRIGVRKWLSEQAPEGPCQVVEVLVTSRLGRRLVLLLPGWSRRSAVMARSEDVVSVQLATRIPKPLHRERLLKPHCVTVGTSVTDFVTKAIEEKLAHAGEPPAMRRATKA
jgi:hypothetical protein